MATDQGPHAVPVSAVAEASVQWHQAWDATNGHYYYYNEALQVRSAAVAYLKYESAPGTKHRWISLGGKNVMTQVLHISIPPSLHEVQDREGRVALASKQHGWWLLKAIHPKHRPQTGRQRSMFDNLLEASYNHHVLARRLQKPSIDTGGVGNY